MHPKNPTVRFTFALFLLLTYALPSLALAQGQPTTKTHAVAMFDTPKYPASFERFDYTSHAAEKGGKIKLHSQGTFDSLNPFIAKGNQAAKLHLLYDTLTVSSADEPFTQYGLVAETIEYPADRSSVTYHLNKAARFHDGKAITADDVVFTFNLLIKEGNPFYGFYYDDITNVVALNPQTVRFDFKDNASQETLLIIGQLAILPKHYWQQRNFSESTLEIPLGSGPYQIQSIEPGRQIVYQRVEDYWAKDHPTHKGSYNFDLISIDYYRDNVVALEAFKSGEYDYRHENTSKLWATAYTGKPIDDGNMIKEEIPHQNPSGMQAYVFNLRNPIFQDIELRKAIALVFDFEWTNKNLFYGAYTRTQSYFENSELASSGLPSAQELQLLEPYRDQLPASVFDQAYQAPTSNGDQRNRKNLRKAKAILDAAGYKVTDNSLISPSGEPISFEILMYLPSFERIANPFVKALKRLGIQATLRMVDTSQYINRLRSFDYDMTNLVISQSLSPGNEQRDFWHSSAALEHGSRNRIGIQNPVVDALVDKVISAQNRQELVTATHALDRVLLNLHLIVPQWHSSSHRLAYWNKFHRPETAPDYDVGYSTGLMTWWAKQPATGTQH
jgi:microcin C transport system substrate-binding protein